MFIKEIPLKGFVKKNILDLIKLALPMGSQKRALMEIASKHLDPEEIDDLRHYLKMDKLFGYVKEYGTSPAILEQTQWAEFKTHVGDKEVQELIALANQKIKSAVDAAAFAQFAPHAAIRIPSLVANNVAGLDDEKFVSSLLLFARDPFHILLLGDPGTGKTEVLRSIAALAPKASFGLGSGTSGVGLSAMFKGDELILGLLPLADEGVACIDELNLMKAQDRAALYNAMEKGFVSYDKGSKHEQLDARVRVIATANPKNDKFVGKGASILRKQVPFQQALLSRFHLVPIIRRPDAHELGEIARKIVRNSKQQLKKGDVEFVKNYVAHMLEQDVSFPKKFEPMVVNFIEDLREDENKFLVEVGPRTVVGIIRIAQAYARMQAKEQVEQEDLLRVMQLVKNIYYVRKSSEA